MKLTFFTFVAGFFISFLSFGQQEKIYYDADWKVCSSSKAEYYRLINFDELGKPKGIVRDYYITGEKQWEGYFSYVDKNDNKKDKNEGESVWYYKNGNKSRRSFFVDNLEDGLTTYWYENGNKAREVKYDMGIPHGTWTDYYESGNLYRVYEFVRGELPGKFFSECDEFGACQKVFYESFTAEDNPNEWPIISNNEMETSIITDKGLLMNSKTELGFRETIRIPLDLENDFSIETIMDFKGGSENSGHGLMWGFKDWDNFYYFYISANGHYKIGAKTEGILLEFVEWTQSGFISKGKQRNLIKILRVGENMLFSINGSIVHTEEFYAFRGNDIGFSISSGQKEILYENLIVKQDIRSELALATAIQTVSANTEWKGNGTGFFIDPTGYIATNYHVVENATEIEVEFIRNGVKTAYPAHVIQSDKLNDLTVIKISSPDFRNFEPLPYNFKSDISDVGTNIFALGYPMALSLMGSEIKFTDGKISSKTGIHGDITYQISVPIQPGNSGGPLFDYDGNLIGITSSGIDRELNITENVNYAIKSSYLKNLVDVLDYNLELPKNNLIANKTLTEKIKILTDYVVLIKIR